jgi:hypothetical protein
MDDEQQQQQQQQADAGDSQAAADPRLAEYETRLQALQAEREAALARVAELEGATTEEGARISELEQALTEARERGLGAYRRALLAEHAGQLVEELVQGATEEALDASVELAKSAYGRIAELVKSQAQAAGEAAAAGAGGATRSAADLESLSPTEKIARGLSAGS